MQQHKNYPFSIGKGSKDINVRCFFAVDKMEKKEVKIENFPTDHMTTDYSAKLTQGYLFPCQRNVTLGEKKEDFSEFKLWHRDFLKKYDLWDDAEEYLESL